MTVVIVDDEAEFRASLEDALRDEGFAVVAAGNGIDGLRLLRAVADPCCVVLDLVMPQMDGKEMWQAMQSDPALASIPVIVTTSDPSRAPPGVPKLKKPIELRELLAEVSRHCPRA